MDEKEEEEKREAPDVLIHLPSLLPGCFFAPLSGRHCLSFSLPSFSRFIKNTSVALSSVSFFLEN